MEKKEASYRKKQKTERTWLNRTKQIKRLIDVLYKEQKEQKTKTDIKNKCTRMKEKNGTDIERRKKDN